MQNLVYIKNVCGFVYTFLNKDYLPRFELNWVDKLSSKKQIT